ncbi:MAG: peptidoglycan-binding domain-containing protein [bacterium]
METSPKPTLKKGDRGEEVTKLQQVLTELGYDCGSPDGIFGPRTETQLKAFQTAEDLEADGIYGNAAKDKIESIFQS